MSLDAVAAHRGARVAALLAVACAACTPAEPPGVRAGEPFPDRRLARLEAPGELVLPAGEALVVNVWATWCEPCRREMPSLERLHRRLAGEGVRVVGITVDSDPRLAAEFVRARGISFENAIDDAHALGAGALAVRKFPTTFVVGADGVVRWREEAARDWSDDASIARVRAAARGGA